MKILDVNVLIDAVNTTSPNHARASAFLERLLNADEVVAMPWHSLLGFLRITTDHRFEPHLTPEAAASIVDGWLALPHVRVVQPGERHWEILRELVEQLPAFGPLVSDAHLAALTIENGAELCSSDVDFARFPRLRWTDPSRPA
ncbi:PIN domain-containing protein [Pseudogemmatithrix spongiicola]|uniref:Ribonuclease VapC n=1 Tax=Pseudogemmatithrix spongiicola TaxID=3062599 RepID=A0AA49JXX3_9BACT|nr:PIN domain-containing protein [Gemmatimonadaceae bacterium 'strain 138']WKW13832.1 PIN domain-containing protein [Gemmatimonadaceae bacterium 'strain 318']